MRQLIDDLFDSPIRIREIGLEEMQNLQTSPRYRRVRAPPAAGPKARRLECTKQREVNRRGAPAAAGRALPLAQRRKSHKRSRSANTASMTGMVTSAVRETTANIMLASKLSAMA